MIYIYSSNHIICHIKDTTLPYLYSNLNKTILFIECSISSTPLFTTAFWICFNFNLSLLFVFIWLICGHNQNRQFQFNIDYLLDVFPLDQLVDTIFTIIIIDWCLLNYLHVDENQTTCRTWNYLLKIVLYSIYNGVRLHLWVAWRNFSRNDQYFNNGIFYVYLN